MTRRACQRQKQALTTYQQHREETPVSKHAQQRSAREYADQHDPAPRALTDLEFVVLRLHEAAIRREGRDALTMETAVASVDAARALLREARK